MKKTSNLISLLFAALALILSLLSPILTENPSFVAWLMAVLLGLSAVALWAFPRFLKNRLVTIVPVAVLMVLVGYTEALLSSLVSQLPVQSSGLLPLLSQYETLQLMLTIGFVVAMVFALRGGQCWAVTGTVVYSALMLYTQVQLLLTYATAASAVSGSGDMLPLIMMAFALVFAFAAQLTMFSGLYAKPATEAPADSAEAPAPETETPSES